MPNDQVKGPQLKGPKPTAEAKQMGSEDIEAYVYSSTSSMGSVADLTSMPVVPD
jgi:hypothetical protein